MTIFSETYQKIVGKRKVRVYEMAEYLDIAPQTLYQILGGRRKPVDEEFTKKLAAYLGLSVYGTDKLLEASERTRLGEELYWQRRICQIFLQTSVSSSLSFDFLCLKTEQKREKQVQVLHSQAEIAEAIAWIVSQDQKERTLCLYANYSNPALNLLVESFARCQPDLRIIQAGGVPSDLTEYDGIRSFFKTLQTIVTLYFCASDYNAYTLSDQNSVLSGPMGSFALTSAGLVLFQEDNSRGLLIQDPQAAECYRQVLDQWLREMKPAFTKGHSLLALIWYFNEIQENLEDHIYMWSRQCCFAPFMDRTLIARYINPDVQNQPDFRQLGSMDTVISFFTQYVKNECAQWKQTDGLMLFPEEGVRNFMETGIIQEFPSSCWSAMDPKDRMTVLDRLIESIEIYPFRMMKHSMGDQRDGFAVFVSGHAGYIQLRQPDGEICILTIHNYRLISILRDYMRSVNQSEYHSKEETVRILKAMKDEFSSFLGD